MYLSGLVKGSFIFVVTKASFTHDYLPTIYLYLPYIYIYNPTLLTNYLSQDLL